MNRAPVGRHWVRLWTVTELEGVSWTGGVYVPYVRTAAGSI